MPDYFLTTRNIRRPRNTPATFADEPGVPSYVIAAPDATTLSPDDRVTGTNAPRRWAEAILDEARRTDPDGTECGDIVFLVHGYNNDARDAFLAHRDLANNLRAEGLEHAVFVSYSWPSQGTFINYLEDDSDARATAIHLVKSGLRLFAALSAPDCRVKLHVLAHSMGALVVQEATRAAAGSKATRDAAWGMTQLILFGADIEAASLGTDVSAVMLAKSQRLTNYFNRHDTVLATSNAKRFLSAPRLGRHGAPDAVLDRMVDIDISEHWQSVRDTHAGNVIAAVPKSHNFYRLDAVFARDVADTIRGDLDRREIPTREPHTSEPGRQRIKPGG